jgi:hypothetical protein
MKILISLLLISLSFTACKKKKDKNGKIQIGKTKIGKIGFGGNGCPSTTSNVKFDVIGINKGQILLDPSMQLQALDRLTRVSCNMALPIEIPKGHRLVISGVQIKGVQDKPSPAAANLKLEVFDAGQTGEKLSIDLTTLPGHFKLGIPLVHKEYKSACGASTILRINTSILTKDEAPNGQVIKIKEISFPNVSLENC